MVSFLRALRAPVAESHMGIVVAICAVVMSLMSLAIVWQAQVIANQRQAIQWLEQLKFGG